MKKTGRELCDNAPVEEVLRGREPKQFTYVMPYYDNPVFLQRQMDHWCKLPDQLMKHVRFIIVDDASPAHPAEPILRRWKVGVPLRHFRIEKDVRWNWLAARNIGAHYAEGGWIMLTDVDHVLPADTLETLVYGLHYDSIIYRFSRREHTGEPYHPHPNSWFMTKAMYWKIGGYDEAASGFYGTDGHYRARCARTAPIRIMRDELIRYEDVDDSYTRRYKRKQPEDKRGKEILQQRAARGLPPQVLSFPYHEVELS